jgi:putative transposase
MPRQARLACPGLLHHVMARGIEGRDIFKDHEDKKSFLSRLADILTAPGSGRLYAWALMPNPVHLLIRPEQQPLSQIMSHLLTAHAVNFNLRHHRKGHFEVEDS